MGSRTAGREIRKYLTNNSGKFEAVSREAAGNRAGGELWVCPNHKMLVWSHCVETCPGSDERTIKRGDADLKSLNDPLDIRVVNRTVNCLGSTHDITAVNGRFNTTCWSVDSGKSVAWRATLNILTEKYRKVLGQEGCHASEGLDPRNHLARHTQREERM